MFLDHHRILSVADPFHLKNGVGFVAAQKAPLATNTNLQEREVTIVLHVCNLQVAEYHLAIVVHPLQAGEMVFHMSQLGQLVICPLTNCGGKEKAP